MAASGPAASGIMMFISPENQIVRRTVERFAEEPEKRGLLDMTVHDFDGEAAAERSGNAESQERWPHLQRRSHPQQREPRRLPGAFCLAQAAPAARIPPPSRFQCLVVAACSGRASLRVRACALTCAPL